MCIVFIYLHIDDVLHSYFIGIDLKVRINNIISLNKKINFDKFSVAALALVIFYHLMLFLMLQILLLIGVMVIGFLLPELGVIPEKIAKISAIAFIISTELSLIVVLIKSARKKFIIELEKIYYERVTGDLDSNIAFEESHLETIFSVTALGSIIWCYLIGLNSLAIQIILLVLTGFTMVFIIIYVIIRFLTTNELRLTAVLSIVLTSISFWSLFNNLNI